MHFQDARLRRLYQRGDARGLPPPLVGRVRRILFALELAEESAVLQRLPGWRLHRLKGDRAGCWAIGVSGKDRLVFRFQGRQARDIELVDYR